MPKTTIINTLNNDWVFSPDELKSFPLPRDRDYELPLNDKHELWGTAESTLFAMVKDNSRCGYFWVPAREAIQQEKVSAKCPELIEKLAKARALLGDVDYELGKMGILGIEDKELREEMEATRNELNNAQNKLMHRVQARLVWAMRHVKSILNQD